jgi:malto-oligosyltrehalose trehalohydrolase
MPFGAHVEPDGSVTFRLWAPDVDRVRLHLVEEDKLLPMQADGAGWHELHTAQAGIGSLYRYVLPDGTHVPDPASRYQPQDVAGPSEVIAPGSHLWRDNDWLGRPWHETVLYELHVGAFTPEGTFRAAIEKLDHLRDLGVTVLEIMPVAEFPGRRNWGYDGVLLFAPDCSYGRPEDFKAFVEAAHARNISVILDVVYNHFGPEGNLIPLYFRDLFTTRHKTSWGDAVNLDAPGSEQVRSFILHNALYWIEEFHLDGLRFDAVHALIDDSPKHILIELAETLRSTITGRPLHLILENENNEARLLCRDQAGDPVLYTAQWNDDLHHVLHTAATHESASYYGDYAGRTDLLGRALAEGFAYQGESMQCTQKSRGEPCTHLPPSAFIGFLQNHDQIGNRAFGERLSQLVEPCLYRTLASICLLLPQVPFLFMGEEWNASQPFLYFCDFHGELADKIRAGRRQEFAAFPEFSDPARRDQIPDPLAESTFASSKLNWAEAEGPGRDWLNLYRELLRIRRERMLTLFARLVPCGRTYTLLGEGAVRIQWKLDTGQSLELLANLADRPSEAAIELRGETIWCQGGPLDGGKLPPWTARWALLPA